MYTTINFKSKKALKEAVAKGEKVTYFQPGPFGGNEPKDGPVFCEGPHYGLRVSKRADGTDHARRARCIAR